jgi:Fic family protein
MRMPQTPPPWPEILQKVNDPTRIAGLMELVRLEPSSRSYLHWDKLRRYAKPKDYSSEEWWLALKLQRIGILKPIPLKDQFGRPFQFCIPDLVMESLHQIDVGAGGSLGLREPIINPQTRNQYLVRSLMEEAITSSQLEGAVTTREEAKEMIRSGRSPRTVDEQMILNNYATMQRITELRNEALTPELVLKLHRLVTDKTLDKPDAAGRYRHEDEKILVIDNYGEVFHSPPPAAEVEGTMKLMCEFANGKSPDYFVPPVLRAIILHFWLAYDHPFVDGNGRTARALFYWAMLKEGCWLFEFISISSILRRAPVKYARSFLYTETDANDLTYFIVAQTTVIQKAIQDLHLYIDRKTAEVQELESHLRALDSFNYRQVNLIRHALKHPNQSYTIQSHKTSNNVAYQTARTDLLDLHLRKVLEQRKRGHQMIFSVPQDLAGRLRTMGSENLK